MRRRSQNDVEFSFHLLQLLRICGATIINLAPPAAARCHTLFEGWFSVLVLPAASDTMVFAVFSDQPCLALPLTICVFATRVFNPGQL